MTMNQAAPLTALLIDDEAYFRKFVGQLLSNAGIELVVEARNGDEALTMFPVTKPGLVILDINMPKMGGIETLQALRILAPDLPIVMLTSVADEAMVERCVTEGATYFIRKDVAANLLIEELRGVLTEVRAESAS